MANRLNGLLAEQIRSDAYAPPLKLPQFSYVIAKLRELSVTWAFGGSAAWPRERIDEAITALQGADRRLRGGAVIEARLA